MKIPRLRLFSQDSHVIEVNGEERMFTAKNRRKRRQARAQQASYEAKNQPAENLPAKVEAPKAEASKVNSKPQNLPATVEKPKVGGNNNLPAVVKKEAEKTTGVIKNSASKATTAMEKLQGKGKGMGKAGKIALVAGGAGVLGGALYAGKKAADKKKKKQ